MTGTRYLAPARAELSEAARYYGEASQTLALSFLREVEVAVASVVALPESAPVLDPPVRRKMLRKFPHSVLYCVTSDGIVIVAVMHHKRQPGYWQDRLTP